MVFLERANKVIQQTAYLNAPNSGVSKTSTFATKFFNSLKNSPTAQFGFASVCVLIGAGLIFLFLKFLYPKKKATIPPQPQPINNSQNQNNPPIKLPTSNLDKTAINSQNTEKKQTKKKKPPQESTKPTYIPSQSDQKQIKSNKISNNESLEQAIQFKTELQPKPENQISLNNNNQEQNTEKKEEAKPQKISTTNLVTENTNTETTDQSAQMLNQKPVDEINKNDQLQTQQNKVPPQEVPKQPEVETSQTPGKKWGLLSYFNPLEYQINTEKISHWLFKNDSESE
jgi:hypothetical protein